MTKEETKKAIEVMQGFCDGKQIQIKKFGDDVWQYVNVPVWDFLTFEYRIKPEPKVRPYKNAKEFLQAQKEHGMYIFEHENINGEVFEYYWIPTIVTDTFVEVRDYRLSYEEFLKKNGNSTYSWQDGTPCGIEEE